PIAQTGAAPQHIGVQAGERLVVQRPPGKLLAGQHGAAKSLLPRDAITDLHDAPPARDLQQSIVLKTRDPSRDVFLRIAAWICVYVVRNVSFWKAGPVIAANLVSFSRRP